MQYTAPDRRNELISYYGPGSGIYLSAQYLRSEAAGSPLRVGIIGLGAGSLAAYASLGDVFRFYEINPLVVKLAWDEFTFLGDCRGKVDIILGDGRLSLERERDRHYDLLVVDAFSGDAIPVHLLTREAIKLYFRHLKTGGILALHITNTHLDLEPVVEKLRTALGKHAVLISTESNEKRNIYRSRWALLTSRSIASSVIRESSGKFSSRSDIQVWTDEYNNLFQILK
jgi:spermidine synthase